MDAEKISPDGNWVAYLFSANTDNNRFDLVVNSLSEPKYRKAYRGADDTYRLQCVAWGLENDNFYYVTHANYRNSLWRQSLSDARPVLIGD